MSGALIAGHSNIRNRLMTYRDFDQFAPEVVNDVMGLVSPVSNPSTLDKLEKEPAPLKLFTSAYETEEMERSRI